MAAPFLGQKMTFWVRNLSVKKIKNHIYSGHKKSRAQRPLWTSVAPWFALGKVCILIAKRSAMAHPRSRRLPFGGRFAPQFAPWQPPVLARWVRSLIGPPLQNVRNQKLFILFPAQAGGLLIYHCADCLFGLVPRILEFD